MIKRYNDFELHLFSDGQQLAIDINGRPIAINLPQPISVPLESVMPKLEGLAFPLTERIDELGYSLYDSVFVKEVASKFQAYLNRRGQEEGVRVCISTQSSVLSDAVWEILCDQLTPAANFLALDPKTPVVRIPRTGKVFDTRVMQVPLRLLAILSSPRLVEKIDPGAEKAMLKQALGRVIARGDITIDYLGFDNPKDANFDRVQEYLAGREIRYDIVHIIGHGLLESGQEGEVAFVEPQDGRQQDVRASSLANLFRSRGVMLVILQSCQSGAVDPTALYFSGVAQQLIASGVPAVLAMQESIDQDVASYFIEKLYTRWLDIGCPFEDALTQARQSVYQQFPERLSTWAIPTLYFCPGVQLLLSRLPQPLETRERQIDAALPQKTRVGKETELVILIRPSTSRGLREILGAQTQDLDPEPEDVRTSSSFKVGFPVDERTGMVSHKNLGVVIETSDFELPRKENMVQLRPEGDDKHVIFLLTPKKEGIARLLIRIIDPDDQGVVLAQLLLKTEVRGGDAFETGYDVVDAVQVDIKEKRKIVEDIVIQLEVVPKDEKYPEIADVEEVSREIVSYLRSRGYSVEPKYTGTKGASVYDIVQIQAAVFLFVVSALQGIMKVRDWRAEKEKTRRLPIEVSLEINGKPLTITASEVESAGKLLERLLLTYPEDFKQVLKKSSIKIKVWVPKKERRRRL